MVDDDFFSLREMEAFTDAMDALDNDFDSTDTQGHRKQKRARAAVKGEGGGDEDGDESDEDNEDDDEDQLDGVDLLKGGRRSCARSIGGFFVVGRSRVWPAVCPQRWPWRPEPDPDELVSDDDQGTQYFFHARLCRPCARGGRLTRCGLCRPAASGGVAPADATYEDFYGDPGASGLGAEDDEEGEEDEDEAGEGNDPEDEEDEDDEDEDQEDAQPATNLLDDDDNGGGDTAAGDDPIGEGRRTWPVRSHLARPNGRRRAWSGNGRAVTESRHAQRLRQLRASIGRLEEESLAKRHWKLMGEVLEWPWALQAFCARRYTGAD